MKSSLLLISLAASVLTLLFAPMLAPVIDPVISTGSTPDLAALASFSPSSIVTWWTSASFTSCPGGTLATLAFCAVACALMELSSRSGQRDRDGGVLGSSSVKTGTDVIKGSDTWDGKGEPRARGYVYGFSGGRYLFESGTPHVFTCGQTGSGKTRFQNIPTLDLLTYGTGGVNVIASDPKNELIELCGDELCRRGYRVMLLDTRHPRRSARYNPIGMICGLAARGDIQGAEQAAEDFASAMIPDEKEGQSSHWATSARGLLASVVLYVALSPDCPDDARHMATVCRVIDEGTEGAGADPSERLKSLMRGLPIDHPARAFASQFLSGGGSELRSVISTLKVHLRPFSSQSIAWLTSGDDIRPEELLTRKTALFLHVMDSGSPYNALFTVLFEQIYAASYEVADVNGGSLPRRTVILGDEWGNLPTVRCLPSLLSLGRSLGLSWYGSVQNISQLNRYGERDGRRKLLANCGVKVALKLGEQEDRQYFTELIGRTTRHTRGTSTSRGGSSSSSTSYSEHADDVIHAWEWTTMSPDRDGAVVVKQAENGVPASHAGTFRAPLVDCTKTPTKSHFDLGSREHEAARRRAYQMKLDEAASARNLEVRTWAPDWPDPAEAPGLLDDDFCGLC